ncbi:MAG: glutamate synthase-related protein, partial [Candidatus Poseidoniaceae archaeon]|nr:glutamate synthase-related protein [Candidatus Poseidoniaceae archaeon]
MVFSSGEPKVPTPTLMSKTLHLMHDGLNARAFGEAPKPEALGDARWTDDLILATWFMAETGEVPENFNYMTGKSNGGFDRLDFKFIPEPEWLEHGEHLDTRLNLNRRDDGRQQLTPDLPIYGGGMSYGSVSVNVMMARARNAKRWNSFMSTGEGGYPSELYEMKENIITQVATGYFGVEEKSIKATPIVEFKYA